MSVPGVTATTAGDEDLENDSTFGDDRRSSIVALDPQYKNYVLENGRRYHAAFIEHAYWGPNDETQSDQLDIFHHMCRILLDQKLFLAPIRPDPQKVLDLGTGTGIWAMDFADLYPSAHVIGTDISAIQPALVPPNLEFIMDDINKQWSNESNSYDLINIRALSGSVKDWQRLYKDIFNSVKPGGWINQLEPSNQLYLNTKPLPDDHVLSQWSSELINAGEMNGQTMKIESLAKEYIENAGFFNVVEKIYRVPLGNWPHRRRQRNLGIWNFTQFNTGLEGFTLRLLTQVLKWNHIEVQALLGDVRSAIRRKDTQAYFNIHVVYAQKPELVLT